MPRRLPRSLVFRLTAIFSLVGMGLIWGMGFFLISSLRSAIHAQVEKEALQVARLLHHRLEEDREAPNKEMLDQADHISIRILDATGREVLASPGMNRKAPMALFPEDPGGDGKDALGTWSTHPSLTARHLRLLSLRTRQGLVHIARDFTDEAWMMTRIERAILIATAVVPLLGALLAWFLAHLGLAPLRPLARQVGEIRPENLNLRLDPQAMCLELAPLARSLNETLGRLELAFQRLSDLNADLAHELRTPIHALQLEAEGLLNRKELPPAAAEPLAGMMETLTHMASVVEQMLFLSRVEEAQPLHRKPLDAGDLLRLAAAPYECLAEEGNVTLRIEAPPGVAVFGDATLLRRALHNLLANGIRLSPKGGTLTLRAFVTDGGGAALEVRDEGAGIPPHVIAQVGRRFLRSESSRTRALGGSGLGLAIVQRIALLHGGTLAFESVEGQGSVIQIKLP